MPTEIPSCYKLKFPQLIIHQIKGAQKASRSVWGTPKMVPGHRLPAGRSRIPSPPAGTGTWWRRRSSDWGRRSLDATFSTSAPAGTAMAAPCNTSELSRLADFFSLVIELSKFIIAQTEYRVFLLLVHLGWDDLNLDLSVQLSAHFSPG